MSSKAEKERAKALQEKFQAILSNLLKDDDNKYCVDCDAKGPRWASWNLGIFLCIRCAGIHRNLGVHISRVKSVNLDSWTAEQVAMMQEVGNSRARAAYEANIPDNFRRPQTDSALEAFIRAKYETKKYIAREWVPPKPTVPKEWLEDERDKKRSKPKPASTIQLNSVPKAKPLPTNSSQEKKSPDQVKAPVASQPPAQTQKSSGAADLIGLDMYYMTQQASSPTGQQPNGGGDLLADIFGNNAPSQSSQPPAGGAGLGSPQGGQQNGSIEANLFEDANSEKVPDKSTKESILALYGSGGGQQQQMFGVPGGVYMPQQNMGMYGNTVPTQMASQQPMGAAAGMQYQQGMMGMQQPNMYAMGQMGGAMQGGMMAGQQPVAGNMMMGGQQMYPQQQQMQQMQFQQMQQQMSAMKLAGAGQMAGMPQGGAAGWGAQSSGQTLSTNLWQ